MERVRSGGNPTAGGLVERWVGVYTEADRDALIQKAAAFVFGKPLSREEMQDLHRDGELVGIKAYFTSSHPTIPYDSIVESGRLVQTFRGYSLDQRGRKASIQTDLYGSSSAYVIYQAPWEGQTQQTARE